MNTHEMGDDHFSLVNDAELYRLITGLYTASRCIDAHEFPGEYDVVLAAAEYLTDLREQRHNGRSV